MAVVAGVRWADTYTWSGPTLNGNPITYKTLGPGDTLTFSPGSITLGLDDAPSTAPAVTPDNDKEQDVARRQDFTFPYTGSQIAAAIERKCVALEAAITEDPGLDRATLVAVFNEPEADVRLARAREAALGTADGQRKRVERLRKEAAPYRQAGAKEFDLDLEDVGHYGLNEGDVEPVEVAKPRRTRRKRDESGELVDA